MYHFHRKEGSRVGSALIAEMSELYSYHYGGWGPEGAKPGQSIKLSPEQIKKRLPEGSFLVWATAFGSMIGYAIAIHTQLPGLGNVAWITQFVVHKDHRKVDVGRSLLFSIWKFSDFFAWGLLSANPYAIRALEKATRRRCQPKLIEKYANELLALGERHVHYLGHSKKFVINEHESRVDTAFNIDHSELREMLNNATNDEKPWTLGALPIGWEWCAFTFHCQAQIPLAVKELEDMLLASDDITKQAYSRMQPQWKSHRWAQYAKEEVEFIRRYSGVPSGSSVLDFGCGDGRHAIELAKVGFDVTAVDYAKEGDDTSYKSPSICPGVKFHHGDCRTTEISKKYDLGICLYDVVGSYADDSRNLEILKNLSKHIADGGYVFLSVMNMELTERMAQAQNWFSISVDPDKLLSLPPSKIMETTGDVFIAFS